LVAQVFHQGLIGLSQPGISKARPSKVAAGFSLLQHKRF
jgi:hypothetical protein